MDLSSLEAFVEVWVGSDRRSPGHSRLHLPDQWNASSDLQMAANSEASIGFFLGKNVLCLAKVCRVTFFVEATNYESTTHPTGVLARNQHE